MRYGTWLSLSAVLATIGCLLLISAGNSQFGTPKSYVALQSTSPGTSQSGHANISGTLTANNLVGGGAGVTALSASNLVSGTVNDGRLSSNVALKNATNTFTSTNLFNGTTRFLGSFVPFGPRTTQIGTNEIIGLSTNVASWGGMFISTPIGGLPYYGYNNGNFEAYTYLDANGKLRFVVGSDTSIGITPAGRLGIGTITPLFKFDAQGSDPFDPTVRIASGTLSVPEVGYRQAAFVSSSGSGYCVGIYSRANSSSPSGSGASYGIIGLANSTTSSNFGVYGQGGQTSGNVNYAGYFNGLLNANELTAIFKEFRIDHPLDPEDKYLIHSCVESDERMNLYRGVVRTDMRGYATVLVPAWFSALNIDIQYQLTIVDEHNTEDFVICKVVKKLDNGEFVLRTSSPNVEVDWQVSGSRNDASARFRPFVVEQTKNKSERGKYEDPEAFGLSDGMAIVPRFSPNSTKN